MSADYVVCEACGSTAPKWGARRVCDRCRKEISGGLLRTGVLRTPTSMGHRIIIRGGTVYPAIKRLTRSTNYVAVCSCRWMSKAQDTREAAEREGAAHSDGGACDA